MGKKEVLKTVAAALALSYNPHQKNIKIYLNLSLPFFHHP
jgi:hypothetical protein